MFPRGYLFDLRAGRHRRPPAPGQPRSRYSLWIGMVLLAIAVGVSLHEIATSLDAEDSRPPLSQLAAQDLRTYPSKTPPTTPGGIIPKPAPPPAKESEQAPKPRLTPPIAAQPPSKPHRLDTSDQGKTSVSLIKRSNTPPPNNGTQQRRPPGPGYSAPPLPGYGWHSPYPWWQPSPHSSQPPYWGQWPYWAPPPNMPR